VNLKATFANLRAFYGYMWGIQGKLLSWREFGQRQRAEPCGEPGLAFTLSRQGFHHAQLRDYLRDLNAPTSANQVSTLYKVIQKGSPDDVHDTDNSVVIFYAPW